MSDSRLSKISRPYLRGEKLLRQIAMLMDHWGEDNASVVIRLVLQEALPNKLRELGIDPNQDVPSPVADEPEAIAPPISPPPDPKPKAKAQSKPTAPKGKGSELQALRSIRNLPESDFS